MVHGPVPVRLMLCGLVGSLPMLTAMLPLSGDPPPVGVNVTPIVHDEFAGTEAPQVPPVAAKSFAFVPPMFSLNDSAKPDRLVTVTVLVFVGAWDVRVPYASVAGKTVSGIVFPVLSATV